MKFNRIFVIVCNSLGVGATNDAFNYGDENSNTLKHIDELHPLFIPNLKKLGFMNTIDLVENKDTMAYYTSAKPMNKEKNAYDSLYEMMGIRNDICFSFYYDKCLPDTLINEIEKNTSRKVIGNVFGDGKKIIKEYGMEHAKDGSLIIYTDEDSSLCVTAHEKIISIDKLYKYAEIIRNICTKEGFKVGKVIARGFIGNNKSNFVFGPNRNDYLLKPPMKSILSKIKDNNFSVISIGNVYDIFDGEGISKKISSNSNKEGIDKILDILDKNFSGVCITELNDFNRLYGINNDVSGYASTIEEFDVEIPMILNKLNNDDLLIITSDHGSDPTITDKLNTRENVPVILYSRIFKDPKLLPMMNSLADIGATIADNFNVDKPMIGTSYLDILK